MGEEERGVGRGRMGSGERKEGEWREEGWEVGRGRKGSGERREGRGMREKGGRGKFTINFCQPGSYSCEGYR